MKKYLKMSDVFDMQPIRLPASWSYEMVAHAVQSGEQKGLTNDIRISLARMELDGLVEISGNTIKIK